MDLFDKAKDAASYDHAAETYDKFIAKLSAPLARCAVALARLEAGQRILDVGTGTGIVVRRAASAVGPSGTVLGIDLSEGMLKVATEAARRQQLANVAFRRMDAEALDLPTESFDAVLSLCAVAHFSNVSAALTEMFRVLRPKHRVVVAIGCGRPPAGSGLLRYCLQRLWAEWKQLGKPTLRAPSALIELVNRQLPATPDAQEEASWVRYHPTQRLLRLVEAAGFRQVEPYWNGHEVTFDSAEEFWDAQASIVTPVRKRLLALEPHQLAALRSEFLEKAQQILERQGVLSYPYGAFFVSGVRQ